MAIPPTLITIVTCIVDHSIQVHHMRCAIPPGERLAVTLHFLATGK